VENEKNFSPPPIDANYIAKVATVAHERYGINVISKLEKE
jgi:hypothetical protein